MSRSWSRTDTLLAAGVGAALLLWFLVTVLGGLPYSLDEGNHLATASVILHGGTIGLSSNYPKLGAYLTAGWLGLTEMTMDAARVHTALVGAAIGVLLFALVRRRCGRLAGVLTALVFGAWSVPHWPVHSGDWPGVLFGLLVLMGWLRFRESGRARPLLLAGLAIGGAGLYFPDLALLLLLLGSTALFLGWIRESGHGAGGGLARRLGLLLGGVLLLALPAAGALAAAGALDEMIYLAFTGPVLYWQQFDQMFLPYPTGFSGGDPSAYYGDFAAVRLVFLLPLLALVAAVVLLVRHADAEAFADRALLTAAATASLLTVFPRSDLGHLVLALPLALPLLAEGATLLARWLAGRLQGALRRVPAVALSLLAAGLAALGVAEAAVHGLSGSWRAPEGIDALDGFPLRGEVAEELESLRRWLDDWSRPGEPVFAYPDFTMFYFLFPDHPPPSRFLAQTPGWFGPADIDEVVADLDRKRVRLAVRLDINPPVGGDPLAACAPVLTGYLGERFAEVGRVGRLTLLVRR